MAANYTANYNLCQWEATDQVQRTDFNADNAKIDAALGDLMISATGTKNLSHIIYDMAMKDYAATGYHGFRRGLMMGRFEDQTSIASMTGDLVLQNGALILSGAGKTGTMTSHNFGVGVDGWNHVIAWIKYDPSGSYSISVNGTPLSLTARWSTRTANQVSCREGQYEADVPASPSSSATVSITLATGEKNEAAIYEYGVMFF